MSETKSVYQTYQGNTYLFGGNAPYVEEMYENFCDAGRVARGELDRSIPTDLPVRVVDRESDSLASGSTVVERTPHVRSRPVELFPDGPANRDTPPPT